MEIQKRRHSYKLVKIVFTLVLMLGIFLGKNEAVSVNALEVVFTGECGDNLTWKLYDGTLTISGSGEMQDYYYNNTPWYDNIKGIKTINFEKGITKIGNYAFYGCTGLEKITLPESVKTIGDYAFGNCSSLKTVVLPESTERIGHYAFTGCTALKEISIPKNVKELGEGVFSGNSSLEKVNFSDNTKKMYDTDGSVVSYWLTIGGNAFNGCEKLKSLELPVQTKALGGYMLSGSGVEKLLIRKGIKEARGALGGANYLEKIEFEEGMEEIPEELCYYRYNGGWDNNTKNLSEIIIPDSVKTVGNYAFCRCTGLEKITLPESIKTIGDYAFGNCSNLKVIYFSGNAPSISTEIFSEDTLTAYYPKNNATWTADIRQNYGGTVTWDIWNPVTHIDPDSSEASLTIMAEFADKKRTKKIEWIDGAYSEKEIELNITVSTDVANSFVDITELSIELYNLKMFKVKGADKETNIGSTYTYTVNTGESVIKGKPVTFYLKLEKKGLTWWKPKDTDSHTGLINITAVGKKSKGENMITATEGIKQLSITYTNEDLIQKKIHTEEEAAAEAEKNAEKNAKTVVQDFVDLSDKMTLDPNIETYIGKNQYEALKMLIYTEISLANISKSYFTEAGLPDQVAVKIMEKYLGYENPPFGIAEKNVPIEVVVAGKDNKQYQFRFDCDVQVYSLMGKEFGINGRITTQMWEVKGPNQKIRNIFCATGIINKGNVKNFSEGVWAVAEGSLMSAYKKVWGNDADKLANGIMESSIDTLASKAAKYGLEKPVKIILQKFYEEKLKSKFSENYFKLLIYPSKLAVVKCPVDVYVYNSDNTLVGSIVNDIVTMNGEGIALWTEGDDKYVQLFDSSYRVEYKSNGTGTMDLTVYDQTCNDINYRSCDFKEVLLDTGISYKQNIAEEFMPGAESYNLENNAGKQIRVDEETQLYEDEFPEGNDENPVMAGDLNQDEEISNTDVVTLARYLAGLTDLGAKQLAAADVNHDGSVDNADLVMLARAVAGLTTLK